MTKYRAWLLSLPPAARIAWLVLVMAVLIGVFAAVFHNPGGIAGGILGGICTAVLSERQIRRDKQAAGRPLSRQDWERVLRARRRLHPTGDPALDAAAKSGSRQGAQLLRWLAIPGAILFGVMAALSIAVAIGAGDRQMWLYAVFFAALAAAYPLLARRARRRDERLRRAAGKDGSG